MNIRMYFLLKNKAIITLNLAYNTPIHTLVIVPTYRLITGRVIGTILIWIPLGRVLQHVACVYEPHMRVE